MQTKIRNVVTSIVLSAASLTMLFGFPVPQASSNPQSDSDVSLPGMVSNSTESAGMHTRADANLPSARYESRINLNEPGMTLERSDARALTLEPNQIGVNRSVAVS